MPPLTPPAPPPAAAPLPAPGHAARLRTAAASELARPDRGQSGGVPAVCRCGDRVTLIPADNGADIAAAAAPLAVQLALAGLVIHLLNDQLVQWGCATTPVAR